jgi:hypothetical protein
VPCVRDLLTVGLGEDLVGGLGPGEGVGAVVPAVDEGADLGVEVFGAGVGAVVDGLAFGQETSTPPVGLDYWIWPGQAGIIPE